MREDMKIVISAADEFSAITGRFRKEVAGMADDITAVSGTWNSFQSSWLKAGAVITAAALAAKKAWDLAAPAAQFEEQRIALDNLARQYDTSSYVMINAIQRAAQGTIAQVDAISIANKGLIMGLNPQQLEFFTAAAERLSGAVGGNTAQAFETLTQAVATGQQRQLRHLGIIVDLEVEYKKYGHELSIAEKQTINFETVSRALNTTFAQMGPDIDTAADKMERLTAKVKDLKISVGQLILEGAGAVYGAFFPAGLESAFAQAESDSKNLYKNLDELKKKAKELAAGGLTIGGETTEGFGDRSEMMKLAAWQTKVDEMYRDNLNQVQDRTQMMNLAIVLSEQEKSQAMFDGMTKIEERAAQMTEYLRTLSQERILFSEEELQAIAIQNQQHEWMEQSRAAITGASYRAMENQMLSLIETGKFSVGEMGQVIAQQVKMELVGISARAAVWAIFETAAGIAASTGPWGLAIFGNPVGHFVAAKTFAATAAATLAGAAAVNAITGPGAQRPQPGTAGGTAGGTASPPYAGGSPSAYPAPLTSEKEQPVTQNITLHVYALDPSSVNWNKIVEDNIAPAMESASARNIIFDIQVTQP